MADYEDDSIAYNSSAPNVWRAAFWSWFDEFKNQRFKLRWGIFRPSFKLAILEPLFVKLIGDRP